MPYIELHACSAFSFLRGGSFPEQLAEAAAELEMPAMALLDRNGVYGAQRFSVAAREHNVRPIIGCELLMEDGAVLPGVSQNGAAGTRATWTGRLKNRASGSERVKRPTNLRIAPDF